MSPHLNNMKGSAIYRTRAKSSFDGRPVLMLNRCAAVRSHARHIFRGSCFNLAISTGSYTGNLPGNDTWLALDRIMIKCELNRTCQEIIYFLSIFSLSHMTHLFLIASPPAPAFSLSLSLFSFVALYFAFPSPLASFSLPIAHTGLCGAHWALNDRTQVKRLTVTGHIL